MGSDDWTEAAVRAVETANPGMTDHADTSFCYPLPGEPNVDADKVPYIVVPLRSFMKELGVQIGYIAAAGHRDKTIYALQADTGSLCKIGKAIDISFTSNSDTQCAATEICSRCNALHG